MINNHFSSGNVYIIDDQISEAQPIIDTLYKQHIPHVYLDGKGSTLPKTPEQVRLIFLDLNLIPTMAANDKKSFKDLHAGILSKLLGNKAGSYLIMIWSKQESAFLDDYKEIFNDELYNLQKKSPLEIISLDKQDYFETSVNEQGNTVYSWKVAKENDLLQLIQQKLNENEAFKTLSVWETIIRKSGHRTVDYLFEVVQDEGDKKQRLDELITSLSVSYLGSDNFYTKLNDNNQKKTDGFLFALTELIDDEIEKEIILNEQYEFSNWSDEESLKKFDNKYRAQLNSKLLTSKERSKKSLTGSVYRVARDRHAYIDILTDCIDDKNGTFGKIVKAFNVDKPEEQILTNQNYFNRRFKVLVKNEEIIPIELNITPLCDIVQTKEKYHRLVPGLLLKANYKQILKKVDRNFVSPLIYLEDQKDVYFFILDYRFFHAITNKNLDKLDKIFSLRKNFVDDIQLKMSNHVSRLGVLNL